MTRITNLNMTGIDVIMTLSGGNPGAMTVLMDIFAKGGAIDPDSALGPLGTALYLDSLEIYDGDIWRLYKDVAHENLTDTIGLLRAVQMGLISQQSLKKYDMTPETVAAVMAELRLMLPAFGAA